MPFICNQVSDLHSMCFELAKDSVKLCCKKAESNHLSQQEIQKVLSDIKNNIIKIDSLYKNQIEDVQDAQKFNNCIRSIVTTINIADDIVDGQEYLMQLSQYLKNMLYSILSVIDGHGFVSLDADEDRKDSNRIVINNFWSELNL